MSGGGESNQIKGVAAMLAAWRGSQSQDALRQNGRKAVLPLETCGGGPLWTATTCMSNLINANNLNIAALSGRYGTMGNRAL